MNSLLAYQLCAFAMAPSGYGYRTDLRPESSISIKERKKRTKENKRVKKARKKSRK